MAPTRRWRRSELIDFAGDAASPAFTPLARLDASGAYAVRGRLAANEGAEIGAAQLAVLILESAPFDVEWRLRDEDRLRHELVLPNSALIAPPGRPVFSRWNSAPVILAVAFEPQFVDQLQDDAGARPQGGVEAHLGVRDPEIDAVFAKLRLELRLGGASGARYLQSLGTILAVHLLQNYARRRKRKPESGLGSRRLRRTVDYVESHLDEPISLAQLADVASLSPHHFAGAFRASAGVAPHHYIMERRIARACERLAEEDAVVTAVAHALGFASHAHFTVNFRRFVGVTPSQFMAGRR